MTAHHDLAAADQRETTTAVPEAAAGANPAGPPDEQREALRELVDLCVKAATDESELERLRDEALATAERKFKRVTADADARRQTAVDAVSRVYADRTGQADLKYTATLGALDDSTNRRRRKIDDERAAVDGEARKQYDQAAWLAESVNDTTQAQIIEEHRQHGEQVKAYVESLDVILIDADNLVRRYGQDPTRIDIGAAPAAKGAAPKEEHKEKAEPYADLFTVEEVDAALSARKTAAEQHLGSLRKLRAPKLFAGSNQLLAALLVIIIGAGIGQLVAGQFATIVWNNVLIGAGAGFVASLILGVVFWIVAKSQVRAVYVPLVKTLREGHEITQRKLQVADMIRRERALATNEQYKRELAEAKQRAAPTMTASARKREAAISSLQTEYTGRRAVIDDEKAKAYTAAAATRDEKTAQIEAAYVQETAGFRQRHDDEMAAARAKFEELRAGLQDQWTRRLDEIRDPIRRESDRVARIPGKWDDPAWETWDPPTRFASKVRFGELSVDLRSIADRVPKSLPVPPAFSLPAVLAFPRHASLLIHTDRAGRADALSTVKMVMLRLLTSLPPGRVRFTMIDPVGLGQNFAGFMHLADHDDALVGGRIWTEADQVDQRLADLTEHMETVIQKYLRNEYPTIDDYNAQAGELAEPYRFLVIADLPTNFSPEAIRRLNAIASSGARCGVYTLVVRDVRTPLPSGVHLDELETHSVNLVRTGDTFVWRDDVFRKFPLTLDAAPSDDALTKILDVVGRHAKDSKRVEVPFENIAPPPEQFWTRTSRDELSVPVGRSGATRLQSLRLGRGVAQHTLIAGKTGSGKSTLLNAIITNIGMWYSPDEVEMYLIDFKKGVEFKAYATNELPHARAIAVESDREFGLSVLQRLDAEMNARGEAYRKAGVQDLKGYRGAHPDQRMPRVLLIIDEYQEFFSEDDRVAQEASLLLDRLVRQGRAFGIHVLLGSQTIGGSSGLARTTIGQMAVRIALQTSEADSQLILGDTNSAARLLSRPGEAIYNDGGGLVEYNSPFQVAWLPDDKRDEFLAKVHHKFQSTDGASKRGNAAVFEGNANADIRKNHLLTQAIAARTRAAAPSVPVAWLGDPVAIKDPTAVTFRRQSGSNVLIVGQQEESAVALCTAIMISIAAQHSPNAVKLVTLDGSPAGASTEGVLARIAGQLDQQHQLVEYRGVDAAIAELADELHRRMESADDAATLPIFVIVYGLQRYRMLRKSEDSFSFSMSDDAPKKPAPDKQLVELLREGPNHGIHIITWADTATNVDRTFDRSAMREFDNRVLMQMSAQDSSTLIDSPAANKLGMFRAIAYSEEQGTTEKFRPYGLPDPSWLTQLLSTQPA